MTKEAASDWKHNPLIVGLLVVFCFPLGLYLLWVHPTWQSRTKWIVTGIFAVVMLIGGLSAERDKRAKSQNVASSQPVAAPVEPPAPVASPNPPEAAPVVAEPVTKPEPATQPLDSSPIMTVAKFPSDYVGKRFNRKFWIAPFKIKNGNDGTWRMIAYDGTVSNDSASQIGEYYLHDSELNLLLTPNQAKQVSAFPAGQFHKCNVAFTIEKRRIGGTDHYVTVISEIYRLGQ